ncbi:MAG: hypothetical protein ACI8SE_002166 [Bacteroidia bacterium]|jgi:hypothetical protein
MRVTILSLCLLFSISSFGQRKWEYALNLNYNSAFVKPIAADTFTNKPGVGFGIMVERNFGGFALQLNPSINQTSYLHDFDNYTSISNAFDVSLLAVKPIDKNKQTFVNLGLIYSYNLSYEERHHAKLTKPLRNTFIRSQPVDYAVQLGLSIDLNPGARLNINYLDFVGGKQSAGAITGQIDYLQVGVQVRFNELLNSDRIHNKYKAEQANIALAKDQVANLSKQGGKELGLLVFVIGTTESKKVGIFESKSPEKRDSLRKVKLSHIRTAIKDHYKFGNFVITTDSLFDNKSDTLKVLNDSIVNSFDLSGHKVYYAFMDNLFLDMNTQLKWGIFMYDDQMKRLKDPFPHFIPYGQLDKDFSEIESLIIYFNQRLEMFKSID